MISLERDILNKEKTCFGGYKDRLSLSSEDYKYRKIELAKTGSPLKGCGITHSSQVGKTEPKGIII